MKDHKKDDLAKKNCKHCIIKFKKSISVTQLMIGKYTDYLKFSDCHMIETLTREFSDFTMPDNFGLNIDFSCISLKGKLNEEIQISLPFLLLTKDLGYFKDDITIVMSSTLHDSELQMRETHNLQEDNQRIFTSLGIVPGYKIPVDYIKYLMNDHFMFIRKCESSMGEKVKGMKRKANKTFESKGIFLLSFQKKVLQQEILKMFDNSMKEKNYKTKLYFGIQSLSLSLRNSQLSSLPFAIMKNINYFKNFISKVEEGNDKKGSMTTIFNNIKALNKEMKSQSIFEKIENFMDSYLGYIFIDSLDFTFNISYDDNRFIQLVFSEFIFDNYINVIEKEMICGLQYIQLTFSDETKLLIESLDITRNLDEFNLEILKICFENKFDYIFKQFDKNFIVKIIFHLLRPSFSIEILVSQFKMRLSYIFLHEMLLSSNILKSYINIYHDEYRYYIYQNILDKVYYDSFKTMEIYELNPEIDIVKKAKVMVTTNLQELSIVFQKEDTEFFEIFGKDVQIINKDFKTLIEASSFEARPLDKKNPGLYQTLFQLKRDHENLRLEIESVPNYPKIIRSQNLRITFINKYIMELDTFFNNLVQEIEVESIFNLKENDKFNGLEKTEAEKEQDRQLSIKEAMANQEKMEVYLEDCLIVIPKSSKDESKLEIFFDNLILKKELVIRDVPMPSLSMEMSVDDKTRKIWENSIKPEIYQQNSLVQAMNLTFEHLGIHSEMGNIKNFLARLNEIEVDLFKGLKKFQKDTKWRFSQFVEMNFKTLNLMEIDEKKLEQISKFFDSNFQEKSDLYNVASDLFKRIDLNVEIEKIDFAREVYIVEDLDCEEESDEDLF